MRVGGKTALSGKDASHLLANRFDGYIRWLLHSPGVAQDPVSYEMREERGHGIVASYWYVLIMMLHYRTWYTLSQTHLLLGGLLRIR